MSETSGSASRGVCLIGFANSKEQTPWDRPNTDFVSLNENWSWYEPLMAQRAAEGKPAPPWAVWFEVHPDEAIGPKKPSEADRGSSAQHWEWLAKQTRPIFMQDVRPDVPAAVKFPLYEMYERFAVRIPALRNRPVYMTSSIGMMLMWAIARGRDASFQPDGSGTHYDWIGLYGIDLAGDSEYVWQRPNAEFFSGFAAGLGIEIEAAPQSALFRGECVYGYEKPPEGSEPLTATFFERQLQNLKGELDKAQNKIGELRGEIARQEAVVHTVHGAIQAQQSNLKMVREFCKRGILLANLYNGKGASELMTVDKVS